MGILRIKGLIELDQFWPAGESDADTTKIKLLVEDNSFEYKETGSDSFKITKAFNDAVSKGQGTTPVIKTRKKDGVQTITVRLQGVDAPELHYNAAPLKKIPEVTDARRKKFNAINSDRRQCFAESATAALLSHLKGLTPTMVLDVVFESEVEKPFEVIDTYGRFIGNIIADNGSDINLWLIANGWASPAFYTSMSPEEITTILNVWKKGKKIKGRTGTSLAKDAGLFDWEMIFRKPGTVAVFTIGDDKGKTIMPKIFRRQVAWMVSKTAKVITAATSFKSFLKKSPDQLVLTADFLNLGLTSSPVHALHDFISLENKILKSPDEFVFQEKPGTLVNSNGKRVETW